MTFHYLIMVKVPVWVAPAPVPTGGAGTELMPLKVVVKVAGVLPDAGVATVDPTYTGVVVAEPTVLTAWTVDTPVMVPPAGPATTPTELTVALPGPEI